MDDVTPGQIATFDQALADVENNLDVLIDLWRTGDPDSPEHIRIAGLCVALGKSEWDHVAFVEILVAAIRRLDRAGQAAPDDGDRPAEIWIDRRRKSGQPCVYGTRLPVETLVRYAEGGNDEVALAAYPGTTTADLDAARAFLARWQPIQDEGEVVTPDRPREWALPYEPGPEVTAVRSARGETWKREPRRPVIDKADGWRLARPMGARWSWETLLRQEGPLSDATPADGQDGDDHG